MAENLKKGVRLATVLTLALLLAFSGLLPNKEGRVIYASSAEPELIITEILANSSGDGNSIADAYEYVEVKNNTSQSIDLSNYKFIFWWTPDLYVTWDLTTSQTIPAGGVRVIWIKNTDGQGKTIANFNAHYETSFTNSTLYTLDIGYNGGLGNNGIKKLILSTDSGREVSIASYNDSVYDDTTTSEDTSVENSSIVYEFPQYRSLGNIQMRKIAPNQQPTPGVIPSPPSIWITEILPNPSAGPGNNDDAFEFVELYNNTASPIDLGGYKFRYFYNHANLSQYYEYDMTVSKVIPAFGFMVVWLRAQQSEGMALDDFANHYNLPVTYLDSSKVYELLVSTPTGNAIGNDGKKSIELRTDGGGVISSATYNDGTSNDAGTRIDVNQDTSIVYGYPVDGTKQMRKLASAQYPTPGSKYNWFAGQTHAHTTYSDDGIESPNPPTPNIPKYAYAMAKSTEYSDFFGLSEHSSHIDDGETDVPNGEWADTKKQADLATEPYKFSAFAGWELTYNTTTAIWGHLNIFNTDWFASRWKTIDGRQYNMYDFYDEIAEYPEAIVQFNHPDYYWGDFEDFAYYNQMADEQTVLLELNEPMQNGVRFDRYIRALDRGWHVAPAFTGDNHREDWMQDDNRTVVMAEANTRELILDAMRERRAYATYGDRDLKVLFEINGQPMGSRLNNPGALNISIVAANPTDEAISKITLYGPGGQVLATETFNSRLAHFTTTLDSRYKYYFAKVEQANGSWTVTAPIWITDTSGMELTMSTGAVSGSAPVLVNAHVKNTTSSTLTNVVVEFYQDGFTTPVDNYRTTNKVEEVTIASIPAGGSVVASTSWTTSGGVGTYQILTRVTGQVNGETKSVTGGIHLPELYITEVVANSPGNTGIDDGWDDYFDEDYDFIEVYNNSKTNVNLKYFKFKDTYNSEIDITTDFIVPSKTTAVLWIKKKNSTKTLADFNSAYGTNLNNAQVLQLETADPNVGLKIRGTSWLDLIRDSDGSTIIRAKINNGIDVKEVQGPDGAHGAHPSVDGKAIKFKYPVDGSLYAEKMESNVTPTPGTVTVDQIAP